ncbi:MAG: hypothetical protein KC549_08880 [Myxococcales bacterium]|nr:hypothetical protein [Myxococcales bacterium]MCB9550176.1 hypothetical protein [Myxococcales bacterium]
MTTALRALPASLPILLVLAAGTAHAQTDADLNLTLSGDAFALSGDERYVSIDECASQLAHAFTLQGDFTGSGEAYEMRLSLTNGATACSWETFGDACDNTLYDGGSDVDCYCLAKTTADSISRTISLADILATTCEVLQQSPSEQRLRLFLQYHADSGETVDLTSDAIDVVLDFLPPTAPDTAPTSVVPVESGLEVAFAAVQQGEVARYEVCARAEGASGAASGATGNEALREGYANCERTTEASTVRLTGLRNGVAYQVVYATFDAAGNRSANSPPASGTPQESYDFAEWYRSRNGPAEGGCAAAPAGGSSAFGLLLLGLVAVRRSRRTR